MHLLDRIDYDLIRRNPKLFLGLQRYYGDAPRTQQTRKAGHFHGPITLSRFTDYTQKHFRNALFETEPIGKVTNPAESNELRPSHTLRTIRVLGMRRHECLSQLRHN